MANTNTSPQRIPSAACGYQSLIMGIISDIRHANLLLLIQRAGSITALADKLDRAHSQLSQLKNRSKHSTTREPREIGDDMSRHIEKKLDLPVGWMDETHSQIAQSARLSDTAMRGNEASLETWPFVRVEPWRYRALPADLHARIEGFVEGIVEAFESRSHTRHEPKFGAF